MSRKYNKTPRQLTVTVEINGQMLSLNKMMEADWRRDRIMELFYQMEKIGLGEVKIGTRGSLSNCTKFYPNDTCPESYEFTYTYYRVRESKKEKAERLAREPVVETKAVEDTLDSINNPFDFLEFDYNLAFAPMLDVAAL